MKEKETQQNKTIAVWKSILYIVLGGLISAAFFGLFMGYGFERSGFTGQFLFGGLVGSILIPWSRDNVISRYFKYFSGVVFALSVVFYFLA